MPQNGELDESTLDEAQIKEEFYKSDNQKIVDQGAKSNARTTNCIAAT